MGKLRGYKAFDRLGLKRPDVVRINTSGLIPMDAIHDVSIYVNPKMQIPVIMDRRAGYSCFRLDKHKLYRYMQDVCLVVPALFNYGTSAVSVAWLLVRGDSNKFRLSRMRDIDGWFKAVTRARPVFDAMHVTYVHVDIKHPTNVRNIKVPDARIRTLTEHAARYYQGDVPEMYKCLV